MTFSELLKKESDETAVACLSFAQLLAKTRPEHGRECAALAIQCELCQSKAMFLKCLAEIEDRIQKNGAVVEKILIERLPRDRGPATKGRVV